MIAKTLAPKPERAPKQDHAKAKARRGALVPRAPKSGESLMLLYRDNPPRGGVHDYVPGELFSSGKAVQMVPYTDDDVVVVVAGRGFVVGPADCPVYMQYVIARPATAEDQAAVAAQRAEEVAKTKRIFDISFNS